MKRLQALPHPSVTERERYALLQGMSYEDFVAFYLDGRPLGKPANFGSAADYVGHVGIVDVVRGVPMVIEAVTGQGVRRIEYAKWLAERPDELVWLGRLRGLSPAKRQAVAEIAAKNLGKPYDFWDFDLVDDSGFYCSKLAWYSIWFGASLAPDDDSNPDRSIWYSPKALMGSKHIELIVNPGSYGSQD